jgi:hypothetical protein
MTETISYLLNFLKKLGTLNLLAIGIAAIVVWLLLSGFTKGLRRGRRDRDSEGIDNEK